MQFFTNPPNPNDEDTKNTNKSNHKKKENSHNKKNINIDTKSFLDESESDSVEHFLDSEAMDSDKDSIMTMININKKEADKIQRMESIEEDDAIAKPKSPFQEFQENNDESKENNDENKENNNDENLCDDSPSTKPKVSKQKKMKIEKLIIYSFLLFVVFFKR